MSDVKAATQAEVKKLRSFQNAKERVGRGKINAANHGRSSIGLKMSNEDRMKLAASGARDLLDGTMQRNQELRDKQSTDSNN
jgi:hypothetical protein